jgi:hypothetical protein
LIVAGNEIGDGVCAFGVGGGVDGGVGGEVAGLDGGAGEDGAGGILGGTEDDAAGVLRARAAAERQIMAAARRRVWVMTR